MHERVQFSEIPQSITQEGEELFFSLFGIPFKAAQDLAKMEGEIGSHWRTIFKLIKEAYDTNRQESEPNRETQ